MGSLVGEDEEIAEDDDYEDDDDNDDEDGYIRTLLEREIANGGTQMQGLLQIHEVQRARSEAIRYVLRV